MKKVIVVSKTHLDLGFTDYAANVYRMYLDTFIPNAIDLAERVNTPEKKNFVWTTGSWILKEALEHGTPQQRERESAQGDVFVAPDGDDANPGTAERPVRTPQRAVELARGLDGDEKTICLAEGAYTVSPMTLTQADSGLTFYAQGNVILNGGLSLDSADFRPYQGEIRVLDLAEYGVTAEQIGQMRAFGQYHTAEKYDAAGSLYCELFCGDQRMTLARYPNQGEYLYTGKIVDNGDSREVYTSSGTQTNANWETMKFPRGGTFEAEPEVIERVRSWTNSPDIWMFGYFQYDWADSTTPLQSAGDGTLTTAYASVYGFKEDAPYYFFNVFEELDQAGEWYIDRDGLKLYWILPEGFEQQNIELSLAMEDLVTIDGAQNITFDGLTFTGTRANAICGTGTASPCAAVRSATSAATPSSWRAIASAWRIMRSSPPAGAASCSPAETGRRCAPRRMW